MAICLCWHRQEWKGRVHHLQHHQRNILDSPWYASLPSKDLLIINCMLIDDRIVGTKKEGLLTGSCLPPDDDRIRWSVIPLRNGTGAYWYVTMFRTSLFGALL